MRARLFKVWTQLGETFWIIPSLIILLCSAMALILVAADKSGLVPKWMITSPFIYSGGATGARTLLGAVASSTIGVAGTVFSITIAALSLAAGQMGPRLLRNFTKDLGNQLTLGVFLGTFCYALLVLRTVRGEAADTFVPHLSLSAGLLLAFVSVAMLVFFVGHIAGRINVDTVIDLVSEYVGRAVAALTLDRAPGRTIRHYDFSDGQVVFDQRHGYLQHFDEAGLAKWAALHEVVIHILVRPGDYIFPGAPVAIVKPPVGDCEAAIRDTTALGAKRTSTQDLEFAIRQLEEVAVRALSPGINDPHTAMSVLVRFGAILCDIARRHLPIGTVFHEGKLALVRPAVTYDGLTDAMLHMIRQNAAGSTGVLCTGLDVLIAVASVERDENRLATLHRHAGLWIADARRDIANPADLADAERRHQDFMTMKAHGPLPREWRSV